MIGETAISASLPVPTRFHPTADTHRAIMAAMGGVAIARLAFAVSAAMAGDLEALTALGFSTLFPLILAFLLMRQGAATSRESLLMRLGTVGTLILIAALPPLSLHLLLGLPVVFLVVELFETRLPPRLRDRIAGWFVRP